MISSYLKSSQFSAYPRMNGDSSNISSNISDVEVTSGAFREAMPKTWVLSALELLNSSQKSDSARFKDRTLFSWNNEK